MNRAKATINGGVCGFVTQVTATSEDSQNVSLAVQSSCDKIHRLGEALPAMVDAYAEIGAGFDGQVLTTARSVLSGCCAGCVAPAGIFKTMQVAAKLALPAQAEINIDRS